MMRFLVLGILLIVLAEDRAHAAQMMFKTTQNISTYEFDRYLRKSMKAESILECANKCLYWQNQNNYCNAFRWVW